jgi:hypothetical protein
LPIKCLSFPVPAEITEPPKISGGQNHKYDWLVEYFSKKINEHVNNCFQLPPNWLDVKHQSINQLYFFIPEVKQYGWS